MVLSIKVFSVQQTWNWKKNHWCFSLVAETSLDWGYLDGYLPRLLCYAVGWCLPGCHWPNHIYSLIQPLAVLRTCTCVVRAWALLLVYLDIANTWLPAWLVDVHVSTGPLIHFVTMSGWLLAHLGTVDAWPLAYIDMADAWPLVLV